MTIIKLLRGGQLTLPADIRKQAQLDDGDLIEVSLEDGTITLQPLLALSSDEAKERIKALLAKSREATAASGMSEKEIAKLIEEEILAVREQQRKRDTRI